MKKNSGLSTIESIMIGLILVLLSYLIIGTFYYKKQNIDENTVTSGTGEIKSIGSGIDLLKTEGENSFNSSSGTSTRDIDLDTLETK